MYKKIAPNDSKCYLGYLNHLVDKYNNTSFLSVGTKHIVADDSALKEEIETKTKEFTIIFIIFSGFLMFYQIFFSPQVKQWTIITYRHGIYKLPHELPKDLRFRILGN